MRIFCFSKRSKIKQTRPYLTRDVSRPRDRRCKSAIPSFPSSRSFPRSERGENLARGQSKRARKFYRAKLARSEPIKPSRYHKYSCSLLFTEQPGPGGNARRIAGNEPFNSLVRVLRRSFSGAARLRFQRDCLSFSFFHGRRKRR